MRGQASGDFERVYTRHVQCDGRHHGEDNDALVTAPNGTQETPAAEQETDRQGLAKKFKKIVRFIEVDG